MSNVATVTWHHVRGTNPPPMDKRILIGWDDVNADPEIVVLESASGLFIRCDGQEWSPDGAQRPTHWAEIPAGP